MAHDKATLISTYENDLYCVKNDTFIEIQNITLKYLV